MFWEHLPFLRWPWSYTNHLTPKYIYPKDNWKKKGGGGGTTVHFGNQNKIPETETQFQKKKNETKKNPKYLQKQKYFPEMEMKC